MKEIDKIGLVTLIAFILLSIGFLSHDWRWDTTLLYSVGMFTIGYLAAKYQRHIKDTGGDD